jgi:hypothetical protein
VLPFVWLLIILLAVFEGPIRRNVRHNFHMLILPLLAFISFFTALVLIRSIKRTELIVSPETRRAMTSLFERLCVEDYSLLYYSGVFLFPYILLLSLYIKKDGLRFPSKNP